MAGRSIFGDAKTALKDLKADLIALKHETQACIMQASMQKAVLGESEKDVKEDIRAIKVKLEKIIKTIEIRARERTSKVVQIERDTINSDIMFLEEQHKSLEETEQTVQSQTSNISMKPLKEGREKCDTIRQLVDEYKVRSNGKSAQFVLHPLLTYLLEQMETFSMGDTVLNPTPVDEGDEETDEPGQLMSEATNVSIDPHHTTFMRSNSSKLIKLPEKGGLSSKPISRQNSGKGSAVQSVNGKDAKELKPVGKSRSEENTTKAAANQKPTQTKSASLKPVAKQLEESTKIQKSKTSVNANDSNVFEEENPYRAIAGLRATIAKRSATEPLIKLMSKETSVFVEGKETEANKPPTFKYQSTLKTMKHKNACYITGIAALENGNVIVCDNVHDSVQLYSPDLQLLSELNCPHPWGVAAVSESAVAITLHYDHKITLVKAASDLERLNEKEITLKCKASLIFDVKYYDYRLYTICINGDVHVLDLKGREYKIIRTGATPNTLKYLDVDLKNEKIYVSGETGIACVNFEGLPLWKYKSPAKAKFTPTGVMVFKDRLLVCGWANHNIVEIYDDGTSNRTLFSEAVERPVAICSSVDGSKMFVTQGDYDMQQDKSISVKVLAVDN